MESPFYEMTHNIETENQIGIDSYRRGYLDGHLAAQKETLSYLINLSDEDLIKWKHYNINVRDNINELIKAIQNAMNVNGANPDA